MDITDRTLLKLLSSRENIENYIDYVKLNALTEEAKVIIEDYQAYFKEFDHSEIDFEQFPDWFHQCRHPELRDAEHKIYTKIFKKIPTTKSETGDAIIRHYQQEAAWKQLELIKREQGFDSQEFSDVLTEYEARQNTTETQGHVVNDITRIVDAVDRSQGLKWRLNCLNHATRGLITGDFIIVAAYVDTGKTTFSASEATFMAKQLTSGRVLWFNNEEHNDKVLQKIWMAALGKPWAYIKERPEKAREAYTQIMHGDVERIKLIDCRGQGVNFIKKICKKENPKLIIIDQIDKLSQGKKRFFSDHDRLKGLYGDVRSIANEYCPIMGISQADASTRWFNKDTQEVSYQKYLDQSQLDGPKIGKPGEADIIITIGRDKELPNIRFIHIPKNKVEGIDEAYRALKAEVRFNGNIARYEDS